MYGAGDDVRHVTVHVNYSLSANDISNNSVSPTDTLLTCLARRAYGIYTTKRLERPPFSLPIHQLLVAYVSAIHRRQALDNRNIVHYEIDICIYEKSVKTRMWANAQRDGRHVNAAKFGPRPLLECRTVTLPRRETR